MPRRIHILPDAVANQIAAGEVVERPASVVKELVENSLDAGAREVEIRLGSGGKREIRVADDGIGMGREDALLALDRHATSKIRVADDLRGIRSFGFRGEALPSIASVSRFTLETSTAGEAVGTLVQVRAGTITAVEDHARRPGTTVRVERLFLNAPARARFLRSPAGETRAVHDTLVPLALANPEVGFRLLSDDRTLLELPPAPSVVERIAAIWGDEAAGGLLALQGDPFIEGVIQRPDRARPGFRRAHLFVDGRPFRDAGLLRAADRGYRTTIPPDHRPWLFLFLRVPPGSVDVNVHPTKAEVRFRDRTSVERQVEEAVRTALEGVESAATLDTASGLPTLPGSSPRSSRPRSSAAPGSPGAAPAGTGLVREGREGAAPRDTQMSFLVTAEERVGERTSGAASPGAASPGSASSRAASRGAALPGADPAARDAAPPTEREGAEGRGYGGAGSASPGKGEGADGARRADATDGSDGSDGSDGTLVHPVEVEGFEAPRLWQVHNRFILAEVRDGLLLIDQHAAHERILFERLMARFDEGVEESQRLLFPLTVRLTSPEVQMVDDLKGLLLRAGFEVEPFGSETVLLQAVPNPHPWFDAEKVFREMIDELTHGSELVRSARNQHERLAMSFACKAAIKAGQPLASREIQELFDQLFATRLPFHDVHGRPTTVRLSRGELERKFGR